jgi:hypothetical protein
VPAGRRAGQAQAQPAPLQGAQIQAGPLQGVQVQATALEPVRNARDEEPRSARAPAGVVLTPKTLMGLLVGLLVLALALCAAVVGLAVSR